MIPNLAKIIFCIFGIIVTGSTQAIIVPILAMRYESLFFILFNNSIQLVIILGLLHFFLNGKKIANPKFKLIVFQSGLYNTLMGICQVYAANPERTPPIIQSILSGLAIIPSVILTKFFLKKNVIYNRIFIIPSLILLLASIIIPLAFMKSNWNAASILWILMYTAGVIFRGSFNIMQEKYLTDTQDPSFNNKVIIVFYTRLIQFFLTIPSFGLEYVIGYDQDPFKEFGHSFIEFFTDWKSFLLLELFIIAYLCLYGFAVYLNSISTNYNMIATAAINPSVAVFFTLFATLNPGIKFPLSIVISSLSCSVLSVILWILGEKKIEYELIN